MKVLIFGRGDYAGSGMQVCKAINHVGKIKCRHFCLTPNPFRFERDMSIPLIEGMHRSEVQWKDFLDKRPPMYPKIVRDVCRFVEEADFVHVWNNEEWEVPRWMNVPTKKIQSFTWTGSHYRLHHKKINKTAKKKQIIVQNPTYRFENEHTATFIPHSVNTDKLKPLPIDERNLNHIACYNAGNKTKTSASSDIEYLEELLNEHFPEKKIALKGRWAWFKRMTFLSKCGFLFEYMDENMGYWGRSTIEAAAFGLPAFSFMSNKALDMSDGRIGIPPIIHVTKSILRRQLSRTFKVDYPALSKVFRNWVVKYYSYDAVGKLYTDFLKGL